MNAIDASLDMCGIESLTHVSHVLKSSISIQANALFAQEEFPTMMLIKNITFVSSVFLAGFPTSTRLTVCSLLTIVVSITLSIKLSTESLSVLFATPAISGIRLTKNVKAAARFTLTAKFAQDMEKNVLNAQLEKFLKPLESVLMILLIVLREEEMIKENFSASNAISQMRQKNTGGIQSKENVL